MPAEKKEWNRTEQQGSPDRESERPLLVPAHALSCDESRPHKDRVVMQGNCSGEAETEHPFTGTGLAHPLPGPDCNRDTCQHWHIRACFKGVARNRKQQQETAPNQRRQTIHASHENRIDAHEDNQESENRRGPIGEMLLCYPGARESCKEVVEGWVRVNAFAKGAPDCSAVGELGNERGIDLVVP